MGAVPRAAWLVALILPTVGIGCFKARFASTRPERLLVSGLPVR